MADHHPATETEQLAAAAVEVAVVNLRRARRHAVALERTAVAVLVFGLVSTAFFVAADLALLVLGTATALGVVVVWAVLRALALLLHLRVDHTMVALADEPTGPRPPTVSGP